MPTYIQRLTNLNIIERKKREKLERRQNENPPEDEAEEVICNRCRQAGHKDARSRICPLNKRYDPEKFAMFKPPIKRRREGEDADDGPPRKKQEATSSSDTSMPTATGTSGETGSTTRTIRSGMKGTSLKEKIAKKGERAAGKIMREESIKNPAPPARCPYCVEKGSYDHDNNPHSSRRSKSCPYHIQNTKEYIEESVGRGFRRFTRKHGIDNLILLGEEEKTTFLRILTETVDDYRTILIKSQLFASYYVRYCLSENLDLPPIIFSQYFFYACMQKIIQRPISNANPNLDRSHIDMVFELYKRRVPLTPIRTVHSNALTSCAIIAAQNFQMHVTENYAKTLRNYIKIRIQEVFNLSADHTNALCEYVFNNSVNSTTGITWPAAVANTPQHQASANAIINFCRISNDPVTLTAIASDPGIFLRKMYDILVYLEDYNNDNIRTFNEIQTNVTYAWVKQMVREAEHFKSFNRKKKNRLSFLVFRTLQGNRDFGNTPWLDNDQLQFILELIETTRAQIRNSRIYLDQDNQDRVNVRIQDCFRPEMALCIRQHKLFTLVPMYSFTRKYMEIDYVCLKSLLRRVHRADGVSLATALIPNNFDSEHEEATFVFSQVFDFSRLRIDINNTGREVFTNKIRTDAFGVDFLMAAPKRQTDGLPDLELSDFTAEELNTTFHLWGADPGVKNIYTASDDHGVEDSHQIRKYSTDEYYTRAGYKKTNRKIMQIKQDNQELLQAETAITTFKTANIDTFCEYARSVINNLATLLAFYDRRFTSKRFLNYIGRQRADAEMVNIFVNGGKKYQKEPFVNADHTDRPKKKRKRRRKGKKKEEKGKGKQKTQKRKPKPLVQDHKIPLVGLGSAVFPSTMRGTLPGLAKRLVKVLKRAEKEGLLVVVPVEEHLTSRICSNCFERNNDFEIDGIPLFSVLHCSNATCNTLWQRDVNASRNIQYIAWSNIVNNQTPAVFR